MQYKFVNRGELGIIPKENALKAGFDTCSGITFYNQDGLIGLAHTMLPLLSTNLLNGAGREYIKKMYSSELITPTEATEALLEKMIENGADKNGLKAILFGCKLDPLGTKNQSESRKAIADLHIPLVLDYSGTLALQTVLLTQDKINLNLQFPYGNKKEHKIEINYPS